MREAIPEYHKSEIDPPEVCEAIADEGRPVPIKAATLGESRVADFNPSELPGIDAVRDRAAALIDQMDKLVQEYQPRPGAITKVSEVRRLAAMAQTHFEQGAMLAAKAIVRAFPKRSVKEQ